MKGWDEMKRNEKGGWDARKRRKGRKGWARDGTPRSVPIGRNYSIPYYLHVGNFAVPCIVDEVHKRINMLTRENTSRCTPYTRGWRVCAHTTRDRATHVKFKHDFWKARHSRGIGDTPIRYALVGFAEVWSSIPSHPRVMRLCHTSQRTLKKLGYIQIVQLTHLSLEDYKL